MKYVFFPFPNVRLFGLLWKKIEIKHKKRRPCYQLQTTNPNQQFFVSWLHPFRCRFQMLGSFRIFFLGIPSTPFHLPHLIALLSSLHQDLGSRPQGWMVAFDEDFWCQFFPQNSRQSPPPSIFCRQIVGSFIFSRRFQSSWRLPSGIVRCLLAAAPMQSAGPSGIGSFIFIGNRIVQTAGPSSSTQSS